MSTKFDDLAEKRMANAIKAIQLLGNLSAPHYKAPCLGVMHVYDTIKHELDEAFKRFEDTKRWRDNEWPAFVTVMSQTTMPDPDVPANPHIGSSVTQALIDAAMPEDVGEMDELDSLLMENGAQRKVIDDLQTQIDHMRAKEKK